MAASLTYTSRHQITIDASDVSCSCGFRASAESFGPVYARKLGHAHLGCPEAETPELLAFVSRRGRAS